MTEFRFWGPVGFSELSIFMATFLMLISKYKERFIFKGKCEVLIWLFLAFQVFVTMPIMTALVFSYENFEKSLPIYVVGFIFSFLFFVLLVENIKHKNMRIETISGLSVAIFVSLNVFYMLFLPESESVRDSAFSKNPNQLVFYILVTLVMISQIRLNPVYYAVVFSFILVVGLRSGSDSFLLSVIVLASFYLYFRITSKFFVNSKGASILHYGIVPFVVLFLLLLKRDQLLIVWNDADEGGVRFDLIVNGLEALRESPLFGLGAGAFSGIDASFQGAEAHNTFIDLALQFGAIFAIVIYTIFLIALFASLRNRDYLLASSLIAFIINSLFHFVGRHFGFWFVFGLAWLIVFRGLPVETKPIREIT